MPTLHDQLNRILRDRRSGSSTLTSRLIKLLLNEFRDTRSARQWTIMRAALDAVSATFPTMALFQNLNELVKRMERKTPGERWTALTTGLEEFLSTLKSSQDAAAQHFVEQNRSRRRFLTLSSSGAVVSALVALRKHRDIHVIVCESRPAREGVAMAQLLGRKGIRTDIVTDAAGGGLVSAVDAVVMGTDWLHPSGFVNKTGSHMLTDLACVYGKDTYVVGSKLRFNRRRPPIEAQSRSLARKLSLHADFEWVPWNACHLLITESGITAPAKSR